MLLLQTYRPSPNQSVLFFFDILPHDLTRHTYKNVQLLDWTKLKITFSWCKKQYLYTPKITESRNSNRYLYTNAHSSIVHSSPMVEATQESVDGWWINNMWSRCTVEYLCMCIVVSLCYFMDCSLPGSSVHGISQARILECVAISFSRGSSQSRDRTHDSNIGR